MQTNITDLRDGVATTHPAALDANAFMRRLAVAAALPAAGFPVSATTLATLASRGGGPPYRLFGRIPLYRWSDALTWAEQRCSSLRHSTSDQK